MYRTANLFVALIVSFASVLVYFESGLEVDGIAEKEAWGLVAVAFGLFFLLMKEYRGTFGAGRKGKMPPWPSLWQRTRR